MPRKQWVFAPDSGGVKIPNAVKIRTGARIQAPQRPLCGGALRRPLHPAGDPLPRPVLLHRRLHRARCHTWLATFRLARDPGGDDRTVAEHAHLCRLRYFGDEERWGFAFFTYSHEKYELSIFPDGDFFGPPEDAFDASAGLYLE